MSTSLTSTIPTEAKAIYVSVKKTLVSRVGAFKELVFPHVDYELVRQGKLKPTQLDFWLWYFVSPGGTVVFMLGCAAYYAIKSAKATDEVTKRDMKRISDAFLMWGLFNGACYSALAWLQRSRQWEQDPTATPTEKLFASRVFVALIVVAGVVAAVNALSFGHVRAVRGI